MKTIKYFLIVFFTILSTFFLAAQKSNNMTDSYNPTYWVEGVYSHKSSENSKQASDVINQVIKNGWQGVLYWGASRDGDKMNYFYNSPFLEKQSWAEFSKDGLSPLVSAAHKQGVKVMVNMEGVNPYHWEENQWTPQNIARVADDLAAAGADAVFEECFEVNADVFVSLARELKSKGVDYISGTDPMLLREANFASLWPETAIIDIYNYYLKRDKIYNIATLTQHGSLGYGWAKYWNKPTSLISPLNRNWGIASDYSPSVVSYLCMIRALQFRLDNFIIFGGMDLFDPIASRKWINEYVQKQEKDRPVFNIVVLLKKGKDYSGSDRGDEGWNRLFNSGDAITSGAMNAGFNVVVSDKVIPADAYWIYTSGGNDDVLPAEVVSLFSTGKPVFLQAGSSIPSGNNLDNSWKTVLSKCGIDGTKPFSYGRGNENPMDVSLPPSQVEDLPYTGYYKGSYLRVTGSDVQRGIDLRAGTVIPTSAIKGNNYCTPNETYGRGPFITGLNEKYVVTPNALNWEMAYPISELLSGAGVMPSSNVWGISGKNVTAFIAIETTELEMKIPGLEDGSEIHVVVWDKKGNKSYDENLSYVAPFKKILREYDFILIDRIDK